MEEAAVEALLEKLSLKIFINDSGIGPSVCVSLHYEDKKISEDSISVFELSQALKPRAY